MSDRLKPCPFCGNSDQKEIRHESMNDARWMRCQKCSATSSWVWFKESVYIPKKTKKPDMTKIRSIWRKDTEKAWNTRPEEAAMQEDIDTLWESNGTSDKEIGDLKDEIEHLKTQLIAETARQMACELECSRLVAENERLKSQLLATAERNGALELQNARYKAALETVADKSNWIIESVLVSDGMTFAHEALDGER